MGKIIKIPSRRLPTMGRKGNILFPPKSTWRRGCETFGPCTMPPWAGTSGMSDEEIAELDAAWAEHDPDYADLLAHVARSERRRKKKEAHEHSD